MYSDIIRRGRAVAGLPVAVAAKRAGVGRQIWYRWESGEVRPRLERVGPIAAALGLDDAQIDALIDSLTA